MKHTKKMKQEPIRTELFYEPVTEQWFLATEDEVALAQECAVQLYSLRDWLSFDEFLAFLGLKGNSESIKLGWSAWAGEMTWGYDIPLFGAQLCSDSGRDYLYLLYPYWPTDDWLDS